MEKFEHKSGLPSWVLFFGSNRCCNLICHSLVYHHVPITFWFSFLRRLQCWEQFVESSISSQNFYSTVFCIFVLLGECMCLHCCGWACDCYSRNIPQLFGVSSKNGCWISEIQESVSSQQSYLDGSWSQFSVNWLPSWIINWSFSTTCFSIGADAFEMWCKYFSVILAVNHALNIVSSWFVYWM